MRPVVDVGDCGDCQRVSLGCNFCSGRRPTLSLHCVCTSRWVVDHYGLDIVVFGVVGIEHGICDIRHIVPSVRLSSDVDLPVLQSKSIHKVLEEA